MAHLNWLLLTSNQIRNASEDAPLKPIKGKKHKKSGVDDDHANNEYMSEKASKAVLALARQQREEIENPRAVQGVGFNEESGDDADFSDDGGEQDDEEDEEDDEEDLVQINGDYVEDAANISEADELALTAFMSSAAPERRTLADIIMEKIRAKVIAICTDAF